MIRDVLIGYVGDTDDDPTQYGCVTPRQRKEITSFVDAGENVPVAKQHRSGYVWVVGTLLGKRYTYNDEDVADQEVRRKYTWNEDEMTALPRLGNKEDNTCDVCGIGPRTRGGTPCHRSATPATIS